MSTTGTLEHQVAVRLPSELLEALDLLAARNGRSRSDELRSAIWVHLGRAANRRLPNETSAVGPPSPALAHPMPDKEAPHAYVSP
jgi:hypothetical protein